MIPSDCHRPYFVPREDVERRVASLQAALRKQEIAVAWIEHLADRLYFSGSPQDGVLLVPAAGPPVFHVRKSLTRAAEEAGVATVRYPGGKAMIAAAWNAAGPGGRIGLALDATPATILLRLQHAGDPERIADLTATVRTIRSVKSPWEIEQIEKASDQVTTMYAGIVEEIRPGITELELTGRVEGSLRASGHGGTVRVRRFGADISMGVVVSGVSALHPTNFNGPVGAEGPYPPSASGAGWRRLAEGETVMLDIVTSYNGYHADTTRTFFLGDDPPAKALAGHQFCRDVLGEIEKRLRPGAVCSEIYRQVLSIAEERGEPQGFMGFGENRVKFLGHGVGLELDEMPVLADRIDVTVEAGMILAVEPKAFLEGIGPVGLESTYVVTDSGSKSLCPTDESLLLVPV